MAIIDGRPFYDGEILLCTVSNGKYVGGAYQCAPLSLNDDGFSEVLMFKPIGLAFLVRMISSYKEGKQFENPKFKNVMKYSRAREVAIDTEVPIDLCIDGEMLFGTHFCIQNMCKVLTFVSPQI